MSKKFTEEQYQKIVNLQEDEYRFSILEGGDDYDYGFWRRLIIVAADVARFANENKLIDELAALANPLTREWAHEQYVEKEKKFHFILKDMQETQGERHHLVRSGRGAIIIYPFAGNDKPKFKESEIKAWGYNPEMFDRE